MIKAIIFDCWSTLFTCKEEPHPFFIFAEKLGRNFSEYEFIKIFEKHLMLEKHSKLEVPIKGMLEELDIKHSNSTVAELKELLNRAFSDHKPYPETMAVLKELKGGYKLGLITNTEHLGFGGLEKKFKLKELFDVILKSYEIGILKPDARVFNMVTKQLGVSKKQALMVGDSLEDDILAAEKLGIKGILIDRKGKHPEYPNRITSLEQLSDFL